MGQQFENNIIYVRHILCVFRHLQVGCESSGAGQPVNYARQGVDWLPVEKQVQAH